jgi:quercetin dioxygenase-like cupin family protein
VTRQVVKKWPDATAYERAPGLTRRTLGQTDDIMLVEYRAEANTVLPEHRHAPQQVGYLVSGALTFTIGGEATRCGPGDCWSIPGGVPHSVVFHRDSVVIECFSPPRPEYAD